jgi:type I restriction enzyme, S subunit
MNDLAARRNGLAVGWTESKLGEIAEINPALDIAKLSSDLSVSFVPMPAVEALTGQIDTSNVRCLSAVAKGYTRFAEGDVLFAKITPCMENGKIAIANNLSNGLGFGSTEFHVIRPQNGISNRYLFYYLLQNAFRNEAEHNMKGTAGQRRVSADFLDNAAIPIPPFGEQARIVAKIDELFSELDAGVASLKRARALLKKYRHAVLKAAVTGELTRDWRERHQGELRESGAELLRRILKAWRAAWEAAELRKLRAKGKPPKDDRWRQKYKEPQPPNTADLPALPEGWVWATLGTLAEVVGGVTKDAKREARGGVSVPYLRVANVQRGYLDLREVKEITVDTDTVASLRLAKNDILFNEGGDIDKLGRGWIWQDELPVCIHQNHVFRARLHLPEFSAKFVSWFANAIGQEYFMREGKQTTNLASVSLSKLKAFPVPVPPTEEIAEIEAELERQLTVLDAFEGLVEQEMRRCSALRQAILKAAFAGMLVPQDANDEPASVLLARIRAERAARPRPARGRRRRATAGARQLELLG